MNEQLSGIGTVSRKATQEQVGKFHYTLRSYRPPGRVIWHADLTVDLDISTAIKAQTDGSLLTLQVEDGRHIDFYVTRVSFGSNSVGVTATGGLRADTFEAPTSRA